MVLLGVIGIVGEQGDIALCVQKTSSVLISIALNITVCLSGFEVHVIMMSVWHWFHLSCSKTMCLSNADIY